MPIIFIIVGVILALKGVEKYYTKHWSDRLKCSVAFQDMHAVEGGEAEFTEIVRNEKRLPIPLMHVKFQTDRGCDFGDEVNFSVSDKTYKNDVFSLMGYQQIKRILKVYCRKRGIYKVDHFDLVTGFLFFDSFSYTKMDADTHLVVYPRTTELGGLADVCKQMVWSSQKKARLITDPFSYAGIREYQPYDPMKSINWNASAKTGELMVNIWEKLSGQPIVILINLQRPAGSLGDEILEESIRIAATWADALMKEGLMVALRTTQDEKVYDEESWDDLNTRLAGIDIQKPGREFADWLRTDVIPFVDENVCYGVISSDDSPEMQEALEELAEVAGEIWLSRPGSAWAERSEHSERVHVDERMVSAYEK